MSLISIAAPEKAAFHKPLWIGFLTFLNREVNMLWVTLRKISRGFCRIKNHPQAVRCLVS